jgi:hypothetical protein
LATVKAIINRKTGFIYFCEQWADLTPGIQVSFPSKSAVANDFAWVIRMDQLEN